MQIKTQPTLARLGKERTHSLSAPAPHSRLSESPSKSVGLFAASQEHSPAPSSTDSPELTPPEPITNYRDYRLSLPPPPPPPLPSGKDRTLSAADTRIEDYVIL